MNRFALILVFSIACGSSSNTGDDVQPDATVPVQLDPMKCAPFAQSFASAAQACGTPLPGGAQATFEGWCKKGLTVAEMCGGDPAAGLECFASPDPTDWICSAGGIYPACNGDLAAALGALCVVALGNPQCASGIRCAFNSDCSAGLTCNSTTEQCMSKTAYCIGLPCQFDSDCPTNEMCNGAEHACVGR